jgi:predicted nuclease of predicted toxin-antitoxin system
MRVLLDECLDERLRHLFPGHDCETARYAGLAGRKNGALLSSAEAAGFDVIVTVDQSISHQQNLNSRKIGIVILQAVTNRFRDLQRLVPATLEALETLEPGQVARIS